MTKFTPPETFPHKCVYIGGSQVTVHGMSVKYDGYFIVEFPSGTVASVDPRDLRDLPKVTSTWQNHDVNGCGGLQATREMADRMATENRIAVLRRDTIDGVTTCHLEDA